jgi:hypothetical protein
VISDQQHRSGFLPMPGMRGHLHLDGREVGVIVVSGCDAALNYGRFSPAEGFADFANLFGRWSLLMHEDEDRPLHPTAQQALSDLERAMDRLHAKIYFPERDVWQKVRQINIDGNDVEWRVV